MIDLNNQGVYWKQKEKNAPAGERFAEEVNMDQERLKRVDSVLEEAVRTGEVAGCNALVLKDGKEVYYGQSGWADKETRQPMARNTIFRLF